MGSIKESDVITRQLFAAAYASKKAALAQGDISQARLGYLYDKLVFSKLKDKLGGRVQYLITGASPISAEVFDFLRICFGAHVLEGYGMTETSCTISLTNLADTTSGHVGSPIPCCEVKLVDIPEMHYLTSDQPHPRGEVCVRGPIVFAGYHKDDQQTAEVIDREGWFHTGDVGSWLSNGRLKIIDRKKNLFKLAQGEYIAPEKIENIYARCPLVAQAFVYGDSFKHQLVGIIVPDSEVLFPWAKQQGIKKSFPSLCKDKDIIASILDGIQAEGRIAGLAGFEQVQAICLVPEPFSVDNDLLTPTFKLKRHQAKERYKSEIDALYTSLDKT